MNLPESCTRRWLQVRRLLNQFRKGKKKKKLYLVWFRHHSRYRSGPCGIWLQIRCYSHPTARLIGLATRKMVSLDVTTVVCQIVDQLNRRLLAFNAARWQRAILLIIFSFTFMRDNGIITKQTHFNLSYYYKSAILLVTTGLDRNRFIAKIKNNNSALFAPPSCENPWGVIDSFRT